MAAQRRRPLRLGDLADLRRVSDPQISPDGLTVAFVVEEADEAANVRRAAIHVAPFAPVGVSSAAGPHGGPRRLTAGESRDTDPRWSPDGRSIAFISDRTGSRQLHLLRLDGGEARRLTDHPTGVQAPAWSPHGDALAVLAAGADRAGDPVPEVEPDARRRVTRITELRSRLEGAGSLGPARAHVWIVRLDDSPPRQLTDGVAEDGDPEWAPDARSIAFTSDRSPARDRHFGGAAVHVVDVLTGATRRVSPEGECAARPAWSPDGRSIAYVAGDGPVDVAGRTTHLYVVPSTGGRRRVLDRTHARGVGYRPGGYLAPSRPAWTADGRALVYLLVDGAATHLARFVTADGSIERLTAGPRAVLAFTASAASGRAALLVTDPTSPAEVVGWDVRVGEAPIGRANRDLLDRLLLARRSRLEVSRPGGFVVEGWLYAPGRRSGRPSGRPVPLVLMVHGGPHNLFGEVFHPDAQLLAARGYAVLAANPRGSGGYGEAFATAVHGDWGGGDLADLLALVDRAIEVADPPIDRNRLAIYGGSYGGFMTCWALAQTDRFRVGVAGAPVTNLASMFGTSDIGPSWIPVEQGGTPVGRWTEFLDRSPIAHVDRVRAPLLMFHGEADLRVPVEQAEQFFVALKSLGRTVELVRVAGEGHVLPGDGSPVHDRAVREATLDWLARFL